MKYLLVICADPALQVSPDEADVRPWAEEMDGRGVTLIGSHLRPSSATTAVRIRDGDLTVTDGPSAETKAVRRVRRHRMRGPGRGDRGGRKAPGRRVRDGRDQAVLAFGED